MSTLLSDGKRSRVTSAIEAVVQGYNGVEQAPGCDVRHATVLRFPGMATDDVVEAAARDVSACFDSDNALSLGLNPSSDFCHLDLTAGVGIQEYFVKQFADETPLLLSCVYSIPSTAADGLTKVDPRRSTPIITTPEGTWLVSLDEGPTADCSEGFRLLSDSQLELCPKTCDLLRSDCHAQIYILYFCNQATAGPAQ